MIYSPVKGASWTLDNTIRRTVNGALKSIDRSLSNFSSRSIVGSINQNKAHQVDSHFVNVYNIACKVYHETDGAFDITTGALDNFWAGKEMSALNLVSQADLYQPLSLTGMDKIWLSKGKLSKNFPDIKLDLRSLAK